MTYSPAHYRANREVYLERSRRYWAAHKVERAAYNAAHRETKSVYNRSYMLARRGLTEAGYEELLAAQGGCCAICKGPPVGKRRLHVDHDHTSGAVRGLLCTNCNTLLGLAHDNIAVLSEAVRYIGKVR